MQGDELFAMVFILGMFSGVFIIYLGLKQRSAQLEMRHRERMAMIERGQIPLDEPIDGPAPRRAYRAAAAASTSLSLGIIVVGIGLAMALVIGLAGEAPTIGLGIGGAVAVIGGAFIVRSIVLPARTPDRQAVAGDTSGPEHHV
jgi:hypothetical protein